MSRRVNITYSVELEEIPEYVGDLISKAYNTLHRPLDSKFNESLGMLKKDNEKEALKTIDEIRQQMFKIDCHLSDCCDILKDYQKTFFDPTKEEPEEPEEPEELEEMEESNDITG